MHHNEPPSPWVRRWAHLVKPAGTVLDVACGHGRHSRLFHDRGHLLTLIDKAQAAMDSIDLSPERCEKVVADIENGPWPFSGRQFDTVIVTNYLWRPLIPTLLASLAPGGVLIYETFTQGNETVGKPSRADFLLKTGELMMVCQPLRTVAFEDGFREEAAGQPARFIQRIAAVREAVPDAGSPGAGNAPLAAPRRYGLP